MTSPQEIPPFSSSQLNEIEGVLCAYLVPELMNEVQIPDLLAAPKSQDEANNRFYFAYNKLFGSLRPKIGKILGRELAEAELGLISARLQTFLKEREI